MAEYRNITEIKPNPKNPRVIKDEKYRQLMHSLATFPEMLEKRPLVCFTDIDGKLVVLGGNMRLKAATELKMKKLPVTLADDWTEEQRAEFLIKDNVGYGEWNWDELQADWDVEKLEDWGLNIPNQFKVEPEATDDDYEIPDEIETDIVLGDLFEIGEHRLLCGDSTDSDSVAKLMNGEKADMGFTSPPYNSGGADFTYDYKAKKTGGFYENYKDDKTKEEYMDFCFSILDNYLIFSKEKHSIFWNVMYNANSRDTYGKIVFSERNPFLVRETIVWNKIGGFPIAGENILSRNSELIFLLSNSQKYLSNQTLKNCIYWNRWDISNANSQDSKNKHKACFPVELPSKAIVDFSKEKMIILDLFLGSGTTMVAAHQLNRKCYGMEIDPKYCQVIIDRMKALDPTLIIKKNGNAI